MSEETTQAVTCAACSQRVCPGAGYLDGPDNCPTRTRSDIVEDVMERYRAPEVARFARAASLVEGSAYTQVPWSSAPTPQTTRLEEVIRFALRMGYQKLGVAFCIGLANEAEVLVPLLENCGFEVVSPRRNWGSTIRRRSPPACTSPCAIPSARPRYSTARRPTTT